MSKIINIPGRIHSTEQGNITTGANEILDDTKGKKQNVINAEVDEALAGLDSSKQDNLTFDNDPVENSTNPVTSGGVYAADALLQQAIEAILALIPSAATALNQLADRAFVNSTVATNTATFRGTYNVVTDLHLAYNASHQDIATALLSAIATADNNDYAFVQIPVSGTSEDIRVTERYKFNGEAWAYEYDLNNSGFTAAQWAAINSGITLALVQKLGALPTASELATALAGKQNTLTFDSAPVSGSQNPVYSGGLYTLFAAIDAKMPSEASASNKLVDENRLAAYVTAIIEALDATYNITSTDGHVTVKVTQADGAITNVEVLTNDIASATALTALGTRVSQNEVDIAALQAAYAAIQGQSVPVIIRPTDTWPVASPAQNVIYRVIDRENTPPTYYTDYMWDGSGTTLADFILMAQYNNAIDPRPKKGSQNLVTSGGVFDNMGALDVSELNATENPHTLATYADLSAALAAIPSDYQKGGMSIKFVSSVDNKYVQCRLMATSFSTTPSDWQGIDVEPTPGSTNFVESGGVFGKLFDWINVKAIVKAVPDNSYGNDDEYVLYIYGNNRVYKKVSGSWENVTSSMRLNTLYLYNGVVYYKESLGNSGKFLPFIDGVNRINLAGEIKDLELFNVTLSESGEKISDSCDNVVYGVDVSAGVFGILQKNVTIAADKGCTACVLCKCKNDNSNISVIKFAADLNVDFPQNEYVELGGGWYLVRSVNPQGTAISSDVRLCFDMRTKSSPETFYISDIRIYDAIVNPTTEFALNDTKTKKDVEGLNNELSLLSNPTYDVKKCIDLTNIISTIWSDITLNVLGEPKIFKVTDNNFGNFDISEGDAASYNLYVGVPCKILLFAHSETSTVIEFKIYDFGTSEYILEESYNAKVGWNSIMFSKIFTSTQLTHKLRFRLKGAGIYLYKCIMFSGEDEPKIIAPSSGQESLSSDYWENKKMACYGDSITAICNGNFSSPYSISDNNWANKVASILGIGNVFGRGIGGQFYSWLNGGGSIAWCDSDGNFVGRLDGTTYDDYLNQSTHDSVLAAIEALGYNPNIHTLVRGTMSSWLRIMTMFPQSMKDDIDVVLVMAHNDASAGASIIDTELAWVEDGNTDIEWAASSYYATYGGDYNISSSLKGAIASTIMKLQAWMPQACIVIMTPISGYGITGELNVELVSQNMQKVAEKVRNIHELMSIPMVDMYANDGINGLNRTAFISDNIHPFTLAGSKMLARTVIGGLRTIVPMDIFD